MLKITKTEGKTTTRDLKSGNFENSRLENVDLSDTISNKVNFSSCNMQFVLFYNSKLNDANFEKTTLNNCKFLNADITGTRF